MTVCILGTEYSIDVCREKDDERLKDCDGYCDWTTKRIVVEEEDFGTLEDMQEYK